MIVIPGGRFLRDLVLALGLASGAVLLGTRYLASPWVVAGASMEPTLVAGDRVGVDLWSYRVREPRPGDVALFDGPEGVPMVKRVVAGPLAGKGRCVSEAFEPVPADEGCFLVEGDNRAHSLDSRQFGPVPHGRFRGRVAWRYWPVSRAGRISGTSPSGLRLPQR